jgi:hypothetical protein
MPNPPKASSCIALRRQFEQERKQREVELEKKETEWAVKNRQLEQAQKSLDDELATRLVGLRRSLRKETCDGESIPRMRGVQDGAPASEA